MSIQYEIRGYAPGDEAQILRGFNTVFRQVCGAGYVDREMEFWRWEFEQNPEGHRITVGVAEDGTIAGHYAGTPCRVHSPFGEVTFVHIVDSFVLEEHRAGLKRPGLFVNIGEVWQQMCRARGDANLYGYPVITAQRVGSRFLGYRPIRVVDYLVRDAASGTNDGVRGLEVEAVAGIPDEVDALWAAFAATQRCALVRDVRYLRWRYDAIPGGARDYVRLTVRRAGRLVGFAILRPVHELIPGACTFVEWLVPSSDGPVAFGEVLDVLLAHATQIARERGRRRLMTVLADHAAEHAALSARGFSIEPSANVLERRLNHILVDDRFGTDWLHEHWWYTLGDTDLA